jgi:glycerophosphoryl diester phosphodiesterase
MFWEADLPLAIAHRGSRLLWPENTMAAFQAAVDLGIKFLETDIHRTRDGVLVCFHDAGLHRTTDGIGEIKKHTLEELSGRDAGFWFAPHEDYPRRGEGIGIPTLEEAMEAFPDVGFILDLKEAGYEEDLARFLADNGWEDRVIVGSFSDRRLRAFRKASEGRVATSAGPTESLAIFAASRVNRSLNTPARALQFPEELLFRTLADRALINAAEELGRQVHVWTVNDPSHMAAFLDAGAHGIISDRPDLLIDLIESRRA